MVSRRSANVGGQRLSQVFAHKPEQLAKLARAGFESATSKTTSSPVTFSFPALLTLSVSDDSMRATRRTPCITASAGVAATIMLDQSMPTMKAAIAGLANVVAALGEPDHMMPPSSVVGLWISDDVRAE